VLHTRKAAWAGVAALADYRPASASAPKIGAMRERNADDPMIQPFT
jgi:hypothetical protein